VEEDTLSERKLVLLITKNVLFAKSEVILHGSVGHQKLTMWIMRIVMMRRLFFIQAIRSPASQPALVTCTVNNSHKVTLKIDTGSSCNILPLSDYIKAKKFALISPTKTCLTMRNNSKATPLGKVMFQVEQSGQSHHLSFFCDEILCDANPRKGELNRDEAYPDPGL